jgi:formylglycine-generating enzyme
MKNCTIRPFLLAILCVSVACGSNCSSGGSGAGSSAPTGGISSTGGTAATGGSGSGGIASPSGGSQAGGTSTNSSTAAGTGGSTGNSGPPPSCQASGPGLTDCGGTGESCCTSIKVPGGSFNRTFTNDSSGAKDLADPATISDFRLDKYLVTVGRYRQFVNKWDGGSGYTPPAGSGKHTHLNGGKGLADSGKPGSYEPGWNASDNDNLAPTNDNLACKADGATWTNSPDKNEKLPINCVDWSEAYAFCIWDGGFLPSEAEFAYAAAAGSEQRKYPWGSQDPGKDNQNAIYGCNYPAGSGTCSGIASIAPVGTAKQGAGKWGHLDLVGDMMQWNLDWFSPSYVNPCNDCARVADGSGRVIRDGYFSSGASTLLVSYRNSLYPTNRFNSFGFRCARTP